MGKYFLQRNHFSATVFLFCHDQAKQFPASNVGLRILTGLSLEKEKMSYSHKSKESVNGVLTKKSQKTKL